MSNSVYIAQSLDGYIADKEGKLDWLETIPNPEHNDFGWSKFMSRIDAIVMGRTTFEKVLSFDCEWPYPKPVFVLSNTLKAVPVGMEDKAEIISGSPEEITAFVKSKGFKNLYIDGGTTVQNFLKADMIDELIVTTIPILLGGGSPLFGELNSRVSLKLIKSEVLLDQLVMNHYQVVR